MGLHPDHPVQGKYTGAESRYQRAITIGEKVLGPRNPELATWLNNMGILRQLQVTFELARQETPCRVSPVLWTNFSYLTVEGLDSNSFAYGRALAVFAVPTVLPIRDNTNGEVVRSVVMLYCLDMQRKISCSVHLCSGLTLP